MSEEQYALPTVASTAPSGEYYRYELQQQIRRMYDENGIVPIIDWLNEVTRRLPELGIGNVEYLDILKEELENFFKEKYPPVSMRRYYFKR